MHPRDIPPVHCTGTSASSLCRLAGTHWTSGAGWISNERRAISIAANHLKKNKRESKLHVSHEDVLKNLTIFKNRYHESNVSFTCWMLRTGFTSSELRHDLLPSSVAKRSSVLKFTAGQKLKRPSGIERFEQWSLQWLAYYNHLYNWVG